ncbi:putative zinc finger CCCH domain-containing protein 29 [Oryza glaberrima]|uniref:putative zinc finger CCCH domain-containing protein 29 n=1 Tax=Oryza glaberrima TaxID=4538 RepID=UPI00224C5A01|nr:putative zinc finger CCCH domain-containing protein 29 [Oryza glaberrima]
MTESTKIKYCRADSGSGSKPLSAETKTRLMADGKKIDEEKKDGTAVRRVLFWFAVLVIRFALLMAMHYYHVRMMAKLEGTNNDGFGLFLTRRRRGGGTPDTRPYCDSGTACLDFRKGGCNHGDACEFAHGVFDNSSADLA